MVYEGEVEGLEPIFDVLTLTERPQSEAFRQLWLGDGVGEVAAHTEEVANHLHTAMLEKREPGRIGGRGSPITYARAGCAPGLLLRSGGRPSP